MEKKDYTLCYSVDYRKLKLVSIREIYLLLLIDKTLVKLWNVDFFASVDLKIGYLQLEVQERGRENTVLLTPDGLYDFKVLQFGLCPALATCPRMMDTILSGLKRQGRDKACRHDHNRSGQHER